MSSRNESAGRGTISLQEESARLPTPEEISDEDVVSLLVDSIGNYSVREAARRAGVSPGTIQRLQSGNWQRLQPAMRRTILQYLARRGLLEESRYARPVESHLVVREPDNVTRFLEQLGPPGEAAEKKREALDSIRRLLTLDRGQAPDWWFKLRGMVETNEL